MTKCQDRSFIRLIDFWVKTDFNNFWAICNKSKVDMKRIHVQLICALQSCFQVQKSNSVHSAFLCMQQLHDTEFKLTSTDRIQMTFLFVSAGIFCFFKIG